MDGGSLVAELRRLDPGAGRTPVRVAALAGLPAALGALLASDRRAVEHTAEGTAERVILAAGARGAVACVAPGRAPDDVAVVHSVAPEAVRALAAHVGADLPEPGTPAAGLREAVVAVLGSLDAAVAAARGQAAHRLHDGPVQELTAAQLLLESAVVADGDSADAARVKRGVDVLRGAILSCRQFMSELAEGRGSGA